MLVFDDGTTDPNHFWFEFEPDLFWCGASRKEARDTWERVPDAGVTLDTLRYHYPTRSTLWTTERS